jgi:hypothetical protein
MIVNILIGTALLFFLGYLCVNYARRYSEGGSNKSKKLVDSLNAKSYKIRFNYDFVPYIWIRVPRSIWSYARNTQLHIDVWSDSGRKAK